MMPLFTDAVAAFKRRSVPRTNSDALLYPLPTGFGSIELSDGTASSYYTIYRSQPWVYAATNKIARSVGRMPLKVYSGEGVDRQRVTEGAAAALMRSPYPGVIPFRLKERCAKSIIVFGNSITIKTGMEHDSDTPTGLLPAPATGWTVGEGDVYVWTSPKGEKYPFERWQIIHARFWDCDDSEFGISALEPLRVTLALEDAARRYGVAAFKNGARPASILKTDKELNADATKALKENLIAIHGGVDKAFQVAVLTHGLTWEPYPVGNLDDAALVEHRKLTREEVAAVIDVPQPTIGILDESNFASVDMFHTMLYQDSVGPYAKLIEESFQADLFDVTPAFMGLRVEFDMHGLMRGSDSTQYRNYATALASGFMTPNEVRARENLPLSDQEDANKLRFPLASTAGAVGAQLAEDTGQEDDTNE